MIRPMTFEDLDQIMDLEEACFKSPWSRISFEAELEKNYARALVKVVEDRIVAYLIAWLIADELHIANVAVMPQARRQGHALALMNHILDEARECSVAVLEVRHLNESARALYYKMGFVDVGIRKNYYADEGEDAILMEKMLN